MREAPSLMLIRSLMAAGCKVTAYDPVASTEAMRVLTLEHGAATCAELIGIAGSADEALEDADALVLVTEWKEFRAPDWTHLAGKLRSRVVFDGRNIYDPEAVAAAGLTYEGIGRLSRGATQ
jgi:UDPglucose 6-dehydrogenase